jgi:hypothetical protein
MYRFTNGHGFCKYLLFSSFRDRPRYTATYIEYRPEDELAALPGHENALVLHAVQLDRPMIPGHTKHRPHGRTWGVQCERGFCQGCGAQDVHNARLYLQLSLEVLPTSILHLPPSRVSDMQCVT